MNKALIISGNLVQDHEFIYPYYRLLEENFIVDVCLLGGKPVEGILGTRIPPNKDQEIININNIQVEKYNLLIIPGGAKAMEYLRQEDIILKKIREFNDKNILIGSICHGAQLLISAKIVNGKKISGYYSIKDDINNAGGIFHEGPAIDDNNIISSPHYKYLGDWMKLIISKFE
ncbi:MAG: putative cysteine protease YraA [Alphaproteobacteria bacterium MarineAlpha5_Bin6]|nr:MAG: putative cysteine protease YraA [Alphaproteobacteria bacterium MarineAlpha5_Bin6]|tara:strand:- start:741 stop:1262 length:522 start_codon:yes stop_codon:yes gene_type:complete